MISIMNVPKTHWLIGVLSLFSHLAAAQTETKLRLETCHSLAKTNYPLMKSYSLIENTRQQSMSNTKKGILPQINFAGQATYQSEVTQIPISLPDMDIPKMSKDQYSLTGEISQSITELFTVKDQKSYVNINAEINANKTDVELYKLRDRINKLFFGILLVDEQIKQTELLENDIQRGIDQTNVAISNGVALKSAADNLEAELLKANQRAIELKATRKGYTDMLSTFIGKTIDENTTLEKPLPPMFSDTIIRPEIKWFDSQERSFDIQRKFIEAKKLPRLSLFFKGGYGRPGLNMLHDDFQGYYIGGARLSWNLSVFYTHKNDKKVLENNQDMVDIQREVFLYNTKLELIQQDAEINKIEELIETDKRIIQHREKVKNTTRNQLKYGTATSNDYLTALTAEDQAKLSLIIHEIDLLMKKYDVQTTTGV